MGKPETVPSQMFSHTRESFDAVYQFKQFRMANHHLETVFKAYGGPCASSPHPRVIGLTKGCKVLEQPRIAECGSSNENPVDLRLANP